MQRLTDVTHTVVFKQRNCLSAATPTSQSARSFTVAATIDNIVTVRGLYPLGLLMINPEGVFKPVEIYHLKYTTQARLSMASPLTRTKISKQAFQLSGTLCQVACTCAYQVDFCRLRTPAQNDTFNCVFNSDIVYFKLCNHPSLVINHLCYYSENYSNIHCVSEKNVTLFIFVIT